MVVSPKAARGVAPSARAALPLAQLVAGRADAGWVSLLNSRALIVGEILLLTGGCACSSMPLSKCTHIVSHHHTVMCMHTQSSCAQSCNHACVHAVTQSFSAHPLPAPPVVAGVARQRDAKGRTRPRHHPSARKDEAAVPTAPPGNHSTPRSIITRPASPAPPPTCPCMLCTAKRNHTCSRV